MSHTFSLRCLPKWFALPCLVMFALAFLLGHWLYVPTVSVTLIAYDRDDKEIHATVTLPNGEHRTTPCEVRGKVGQRVTFVVEYESEQPKKVPWKFEKGVDKCPVKFGEKEIIAVTLRTFGTNGEEVPATVSEPSGKVATQPTGYACTQQNLVGTTLRLNFKPNKPGYGETDEEVKWMRASEFRDWLLHKFPTEVLYKKDPLYDRHKWAKRLEELKGRIGAVRYDYPIVFKASGRKPVYRCDVCNEQFDSEQKLFEHKRVKHPQPKYKCDICGREFNSEQDLREHKKTHPPKPDTPISWEQITSKRKLTETDLQGKTPWARRLTINEFYARHGKIFTTKEVREYFERQPWYHGVTKNDAEVERQFSDIEKYNRDFIKTHM